MKLHCRHFFVIKSLCVDDSSTVNVIPLCLLRPQPTHVTTIGTTSIHLPLNIQVILTMHDNISKTSITSNLHQYIQMPSLTHYNGCK